MIILQQMTWNNWFSYGESNSIDFNKNNVTQIIGVNGSGKSSIIHILQEVLYGKNTINTKKADLKNWDIPKAKLSASVTFSEDTDIYKVDLIRSSTISLSLTKNGKDISSHTATNTYKTIESILGIDFKTFEQLVYQSSIFSLQFLTATDTNRKKFLIGLLNLDKYILLHEKFKALSKDITLQIAELQGSINTISKWIEENNHIDLQPKELQEIPDTIDNKEIIQKEIALKNIESTNEKIGTNNTRIANINKMPEIEKPGEKPKVKEQLNRDSIAAETKAKILIGEIHFLKGLSGECPTCWQPIDLDKRKSLCAERQKKKDNLILHADELKKEYTAMLTELNDWQAQKRQFDKRDQLINFIDYKLPTKLNDIEILQKEVKIAKQKIKKLSDIYEAVISSNAKVVAHNEQLENIQDKIIQYSKELGKNKTHIEELIKINTSIKVLSSTFSTKGLITYKIEFLIKDLESLINKYLIELSDGKFQLYFTMLGDKLNIDISNNGKIVSITSLSTGERNRVNSATLLAIRAVMSELSETKVNLLFLDEILGTLDEEGKERLIEVLLKEHDLNTFLISHSYSHPLLEKIEVKKCNGISKIME